MTAARHTAAIAVAAMLSRCTLYFIAGWEIGQYKLLR